MTFCKDMSSRLEEPFCKNICFLGIDTSYCSDLYMFLIRLNHLIAVLAISEKAPAHSLDTSQKVAKNGILTKRLLENQRVRENQKQGTRSCVLTK